MTQAFSTYKIFKHSIADKLVALEFHGRALTLLKLDQVIYLTENDNYPAKIIRIVAYGHNFDEISPAMGCAITVELSGPIPEDMEDFYLQTAG